MNAAGGYIKLHRKITRWGWYDDPNTFRVFIHLLLMANFEDGEWHDTVIKRGQYLTSINHLAKETKLSYQTIRTAISHLKSTGEITCQSTSHYTLITIANYERYQDVDFNTNEQTNEQTNTLTNEQLTNNQQQYKKNKKNKEINNIYLVQNEAENAAENDPNLMEDCVVVYNSVCKSLPRVSKISDSRKRKIAARLKEFSPEEIRTAFEKAEASDFMTGRSGKWRCDFDWIMHSEDRIQRILEGKYDNVKKMDPLDELHEDLQKQLADLGREESWGTI